MCAEGAKGGHVSVRTSRLRLAVTQRAAAQRNGTCINSKRAYTIYTRKWRSGYMVIGLLVLASMVAIAFDDDVAAAGLLAAAVLVSVGGF
jgi:hypothetical protein